MNISDDNHGQSASQSGRAQNEQESWANNQKTHSEEAKESRAAREKERLLWEEEERLKKIEERERVEKERLEAERRALYAELEGLDYDLLSLVDYPTDHELYAAKRARTLWFIALGSALFLFLASLLSLTSPWVGGIAGGIAFVLWLTHGAGMMSYFPSLNRYPNLVTQRKRLKRDLIEYIRNLEGRQGYMHRIYPLVQFNPRLGARKFKRLALMSKEHTLLANLRTLQDTRAYHEYMVEALRGYQELLQQEKEDKFVESMDFDPELLEEKAQQQAQKDNTAAPAEQKESPKAAQEPDPTLFTPRDQG
ncbi:hypothetical protein [Marinospirillum alkaliphilum]|uniref:Uncharacterized protein n=1 Tax=Marinospirillum alkaliphilum DSM 21637 TaxID=1122209 RepID=A0A1K1Y4U6_9GAMM|nr:hypothetical protein [Marinospirillum alkaliphilum]SFX56774.1 hypothetical protein SAMN02745752_02118 [Marinospirillum alkaliphilum DSM 21637]